MNSEEKKIVSDTKEEDAWTIRSRKGYIILLWLAVTLAIIAKFAVPNMFKSIYSFASCETTACLGNQAVYRFSFGAFAFFLVMAGLTFCAPSLHLEWWAIKTIAFFGCLLVGFAIPNPVYTIYAEVSRVGSLIFLVVQIIIFVDMAHDLHEFLTDPGTEEDAGKRRKCIYLLMSAILIILGFVGMIALFVVYRPCPLNVIFIVIPLVFALINTFLSLTERIGKGLLAPSLVFAYTEFLAWQAISSNPYESCLRKVGGTSSSVAMVVISLIVIVFSLTYTSTSVATSAQSAFASEARKDAAPRYWSFHLIMSMGAMYTAMLLTNWGSSQDDSGTSVSIGVQSMWIKIASCWLTIILFTWTLIAPICCPNRDFSDAHNQFGS